MKLLIEESLIQLRVKADNCESAIRIAAQPLVDHGKIEGRYVDAILDSLMKHGPYFVIMPGIALPHARPEEGVISDGIGITTLAQPIEFGSEANDPVRYIFTLSATGDEKHLEVLSHLALLMEDESFFEFLNDAKSSNEVVTYINERGEDDV